MSKCWQKIFLRIFKIFDITFDKIYVWTFFMLFNILQLYKITLNHFLFIFVLILSNPTHQDKEIDLSLSNVKTNVHKYSFQHLSHSPCNLSFLLTKTSLQLNTKISKTLFSLKILCNFLGKSFFFFFPSLII